jgi:geranylgeranyl diphosphate synthase type II
MAMADSYYAEGLALLDGISLPAERKEMLKQFVCSLMNRKV